MRSPAVVAGVDGSAASNDAARWAASAAMRRNIPLRVIHAATPIVTPAFPDGAILAMVDWEGLAADLLKTATEPLRRLHPELQIETELYAGQSAAMALSIEAEFADLVVVGSRGRGGFTGLLLGSTATQVLGKVAAPVVVVRPPRTDQGQASPGDPVVVGVDGSDPAQRAVRFAVTEAALRCTTVSVVHACAAPDNPGMAAPLATDILDWPLLAEHAVEVLNETVARVRKDFPRLGVTGQVFNSQPIDALLEASRHAQLLVLGSRGRGAFTGLVLGSVSHSLVRGASCPVAVLR